MVGDADAVTLARDIETACVRGEYMQQERSTGERTEETSVGTTFALVQRRAFLHLDDEWALAVAKVRRVVQRRQRERLVRRRVPVDDRRAEDAGELGAAVRVRGARQDGRRGERGKAESDKLSGGEHGCSGLIGIMF